MKLLGFTAFRHAAVGASKHVMAKSLGDLALAGTGVAMAAGSVVFAGYMLTQADHGPKVNGMQYLAIFAKPNGASHPSSSHPMVIDAPGPAPAPAQAGAPVAAAPPAPSPTAAAPPHVAGDGLDMAPTGSIAHGAASAPAPTPESFRILAVEPGIAWLSNGSEIRVVKPGDVAPGLGRVASIEKRDGRWLLVGDSGAPLLTSDAPGKKAGSPPFARRMIFGPDE
jgi:hypothetical protein